MNSYSVVVVDDHTLFATALENLIESFGSFKVLYHAKSGMDFIQRLEVIEDVPDIALVDVKMPAMNGIETTQWISANRPSIRVIGLSMDDEETTIIKMLQAGARGYLLKDINPATLRRAFRDVLEKDFYYSDCITPSVIRNTHRRFSGDLPLKEREIEFLKHVCTEKTYKEIASEMLLSPKTIDGYRESLFEKLQIKSRVGLAIYAIKNEIYKIT